MNDYRGITAYAGFGPTIYRPEQVDSSLWLVRVSHYPDSRIVDSYYFARKEDAERFYENWLESSRLERIADDMDREIEGAEMSDPKYMVEQASYRVWNLFELRGGDLPGYHLIATVECEEEVIERITDALNGRACTWTQDEDDGFWYTECGNAYEFMEDGPEENNHKFCPYCGGRLNVRETEDDE